MLAESHGRLRQWTYPLPLEPASDGTYVVSGQARQLWPLSRNSSANIALRDPVSNETAVQTLNSPR
jgi:hypothetical protein